MWHETPYNILQFPSKDQMTFFFPRATVLASISCLHSCFSAWSAGHNETFFVGCSGLSVHLRNHSEKEKRKKQSLMARIAQRYRWKKSVASYKSWWVFFLAGLARGKIKSIFNSRGATQRHALRHWARSLLCMEHGNVLSMLIGGTVKTSFFFVTGKGFGIFFHILWQICEFVTSLHITSMAGIALGWLRWLTIFLWL